MARPDFEDRTGARAPRPPRASSPPLLAPAVAFAALFIAGLLAPTLLAGGAPLPSPFAPAVSTLDHASRHPSALRAGALLHFCAAVPLGVFGVSVADRLRTLRRGKVGALLALYGGLAASFFLMLSALAQWALSQASAVDQPGVAQALHLAAFAAGGPGHVVPLGLLVGGVASATARAELLPKGVVLVGLATAGLAVLSTLGLVTPAALYLLPLARFSALGFVLYAGAALPASRLRGQGRIARPPSA